MRVGLITGEYPPMRGGIATQTQFLARELIARGHIVHVLTDIRGNAVNPNVHIHPLVTGWGLRTVRLVRAWASENALDVVNLHYQTAAYQMSPVIHFLPDVVRSTAPFVTTFHDQRFPYLFPKAGPLRPWIVNRLARASSGIVATNLEDAQQLARHNSHMAVIPIGSNLDEDTRSDVGAHHMFKDDTEAFVLAFFGFVNHSKGLDILLNSVAALRQNGIPARLLMIGDRTGSSDPTNAAYTDQIAQIIDECGLGDAVRWTGFVPDADVRAYLRTADAVVMPFRDGASYRRSSMMSALASGSALVTTTPSVTVPSFQHGENMLLVPPGDAPALTNTLHSLYNNRPLTEKLRAGALRLKQTFGWEGITNSYIDFYRSLTGNIA